MNQRGFIVISILITVAVIALGGYIFFTRQRQLYLQTSTVTSFPTITSTAATTPILQSSFSIQSLTPSTGKIGASVTIKGSGFTPTQNVVRFGSGYSTYLNSIDGTTLKFTIPSEQEECHPSGNPCLEIKNITVTPGEYMVYVMNANRTSNSVMFLVTE